MVKLRELVGTREPGRRRGWRKVKEVRPPSLPALPPTPMSNDVTTGHGCRRLEVSFV